MHPGQAWPCWRALCSFPSGQQDSKRPSVPSPWVCGSRLGLPVTRACSRPLGQLVVVLISTLWAKAPCLGFSQFGEPLSSQVHTACLWMRPPRHPWSPVATAPGVPAQLRGREGDRSSGRPHLPSWMVPRWPAQVPTVFFPCSLRVASSPSGGLVSHFWF